MKIAIVSPAIVSPEYESEKYYCSQQVSLAKALVKEGFKVDIFTIGSEERSKKVEVSKNKLINIFYLKSISLIPKQPVMYQLERYLKKGKYDIIQVSDDCALNTVYTIHLAKKIRVPVLIFQGPYKYSNKFPWKLLWPLYDTLLHTYIKKNIYKIVSKTEATKKFMIKKGYKNVETIPIGVDTKLFYPRKKLTKKRLGINKGPLILYVGVLEDRKNILLLIDVLSILVKDMPNIKLVVIGKGKLKKILINKITKYNIGNNIILIDSVLNEELPFFYSFSDLFIILSKYEIFGIVLLESMACGTPVVSTPTAGALDVIKHNYNGLIVNYNKNDIANSVLDLLTNEKRLYKINNFALKTIKMSYDWGVIAKRYKKLYEECLKNSL